MIEAYILDVGHGNCAVIIGGDHCVVVDAGHAPTLLDFLADRGVRKIDAFILSHADEDHIIGAQAVLGSDLVAVSSVYVNPDAQKSTVLWDDVINALEERSRSTGQDRLTLEVGHAGRPPIHLGVGKLEFLSPLISAFLHGTGGRLRNGRRLDTNGNSIIMRIVDESGPRLLLAADVTAAAWQRLRSFHSDLRAEVLIVPHHGGRISLFDTDMAVIANDVLPALAIVSNGRGGHDNPRAGIVAELQRHGCYVACTQLSALCGPNGNSGVAYPKLPSRGSGEQRCCAGSLLVKILPFKAVVSGLEEHAKFVDLISAYPPLCRRSVNMKRRRQSSP